MRHDTRRGLFGGERERNRGAGRLYTWAALELPLRAIGTIITLAGISAIAGFASCSSDGKSAATAQCDLNNPAPRAAAPKSALHNVHRLGDRIISGAAPDGGGAFDELKSMGVRTILSVDGAVPDVAAAEARGMRYVHIPITYAEVTEEQRLEIARAIRDLPGPVYIHCHHGKHRSPAAAAAAAIALGITTSEEGIAFMKEAGTASNYRGLYACVAEATVASAAALASAPDDFPAVHRASGIVACMIEVDQAYEHLAAIQTSGWLTPTDQPDLVPAAEAGRLTDNLRIAGEDPRGRAHGADFDARLAQAVANASGVEEMLIRGAPKAVLDSKWKSVVNSCKECHAEHRDKRGK